MYLSVIIPTRNRAKYLYKALESITKQNFPKEEFEVIVVDNGSTDNTKEVVNSFQNKLKNLKYFYEKTPGLHVGRHKGLKESTADILVYADDDIEAFPTWLEGINESFEDPSVALVGGNNLPNYEVPPPQWVELLWGNTPLGQANGMYSVLDFGNKIHEIYPHFVWGCNFSIRKEVLIRVGGFHPDGMPDEFLRYRGDGESAVSGEILRSGQKTVFNPKASVYHLVPAKRMTFDYIFKRGYIQGISDSYSSIRQKHKVDPRRTIRTSILRQIHHLRMQVNGLISTGMRPHDQFRLGWFKGYLYHQHEVSNDERLLEWVVRENYFGENGEIPI